MVPPSSCFLFNFFPKPTSHWLDTANCCQLWRKKFKWGKVETDVSPVLELTPSPLLSFYVHSHVLLYTSDSLTGIWMNRVSCRGVIFRKTRIQQWVTLPSWTPTLADVHMRTLAQAVTCWLFFAFFCARMGVKLNKPSLSLSLSLSDTNDCNPHPW